LAKEYARPPHPFDLTESVSNQLWNQQETSLDPLLLPTQPQPWESIYTHGEIVSLKMLATGLVGPLSPPNLASCRFSADEALVAIYVARAWGLARNPKSKAFLSGKPAFEAWDMLCSRVRGVTTSSASWDHWWLKLLSALKLRPEGVPEEYAMVWRSAISSLPKWEKTKRNQTFWNSVNQCASLIAREPAWRWQLIALIQKTRAGSIPSYLSTDDISEVPLG